MLLLCAVSGLTPVQAKARLARYEQLLKAPVKDVAIGGSIYIPPGPRLGSQVIDARNVKKGFGDRVLMKDLSFSIPPGAIVGIIGPNGAGKSTLIRMIQGLDKPDSGELLVGNSVQLAAVSQDRSDQLSSDSSVFHEISDGQDTLELGAHSVSARAYCSWFGFKSADQQKKVSVLSGGERNRCQLAKIVKSGANVLILDEVSVHPIDAAVADDCCSQRTIWMWTPSAPWKRRCWTSLGVCWWSATIALCWIVSARISCPSRATRRSSSILATTRSTAPGEQRIWSRRGRFLHLSL